MRLKFCEHEKYKMKMNMHKTHDSTSKAQDIETPPQRFLPAQREVLRRSLQDICNYIL